MINVVRGNLMMHDVGRLAPPPQRSQSPARHLPDAPVSYDIAPARALVARHLGLTYPYQCTFGDAPLRIDAGVFCPTLTRVSPMLLQEIEFRPGDRVLDAFAGSGAFGLNAAFRRAARVTTIDSSALSYACCKYNFEKNGFTDLADIRLGTVAETLALTDQFDLVIANPPLLPGERNGLLGEAIYDPGCRSTLHFVEQLPRVLAENGHCYLATSDIIERCGTDIGQLCASNGLTSKIAAELHTESEAYRVHHIWRSEDAR